MAKILIVDDKSSNRIALEKVLRSVRADVVAAESGPEALTLCLQQDFAMVLLDVNMPGMNGYEVAKRLHQAENTRHLPILFVTALYADTRNKLMGYDVGAVDFIQKPIDDKIVLSKVNVFLELYNRRREVEILNSHLEQRVMEEVEKNRKKDLLLMQQSRLAAMGEMIGNIAHQWRQPINALNLILANIQSAHECQELSDDFLDEKVENGQQIILKMSATIDDFRNFFRPDKKKTRFDLESVVYDALSLVEAGLKSHHIAVRFDPPETPVHAVGYANEYSQVVLLVLTNAKDAITQSMPRSGGKIFIELVNEDDQVRLSVRDNGGGIDESILDRIFDPYFTTKNNQQGTGIGLYMAKMIIEEHMGGTISAVNVDGGAAFHVSIPLNLDTEPVIPSPPLSGDRPSPTSAGPPPPGS